MLQIGSAVGRTVRALNPPLSSSGPNTFFTRRVGAFEDANEQKVSPDVTGPAGALERDWSEVCKE